MSSSTTTSYTKLNDVVIHDEEMDLKYDDNNNNDKIINETKIDDKNNMEDDNDTKATSSFGSAVLNTFNTMVGVGTLSLPFALRHGGWVMLILLFVVYILATQAARLIGIMMDDDHSLKSYGDIAMKAFGKRGMALVTLIFSIELFCACGMFLVLTGDTLNSIFPQYSQQTFVLFSSIFMIPTALTTRLDFLAYLSFLGMTGSTVLLLVIVYLGGRSNVEDGSYLHPQPTRIWTTIEEAPFSIGLCIVGFAGHAVFPSIKNSMKNKKSYGKMMITSFTLAFIFYLTVAILGYLMYGEDVEKEVDLNFREGINNGKHGKFTFAVFAVSLTSWLVAINPATKFGLCMNPVAKNLEQIFGVQNSPIKVLLIPIILSGLCLGLCIILPFFAKMASFIGALCSSFSSVIFPFYAYYTLSYEKLNTWERSMNLFIAFFGFVMCITGLFGVIESFELQN